MRTFAILAIGLLSTIARAEDWPQFLGANRDSTTTLKVDAWKELPKPLWTAEVGEAHSSPIVIDGTVYLFFKVAKKEEEALAAFDAKTGEKKWEKSYERTKYTNIFGNGPRSTPCFDGGLVYTFGCTGLLTAWDAKTGDRKWQVDTLKEFAASNLFFGMSTSPTIVGKHVVVMVGGKGGGIVGFDKLTGKVAWQATNDRASYASPIVAGDAKSPELIFLTGDHVRSVTAETGKELWDYKFVDALLESSTTPVKIGDVIVAGSVKSGSVGLKLDGTGVKELWKNEKLTCYFSTPVAVGKDLYMINGEAKFPGASISLRCVDPATGKVKWEKDKLGEYHAAILYTANGKLLLLDDLGTLRLIEPNPKEYTELAKGKLCGKTWAHPATADGRLFVRDDKKLMAVELAK